MKRDTDKETGGKKENELKKRRKEGEREETGRKGEVERKQMDGEREVKERKKRETPHTHPPYWWLHWERRLFLCVCGGKVNVQPG